MFFIHVCVIFNSLKTNTTGINYAHLTNKCQT